jgi:hypothetical protein
MTGKANKRSREFRGKKQPRVVQAKEIQKGSMKSVSQKDYPELRLFYQLLPTFPPPYKPPNPALHVKMFAWINQ